ncbi:MAG: hypothetical protein Q8R16_00160, partial [bacterium]|nr:hypothetical protein [bacterium]
MDQRPSQSILTPPPRRAIRRVFVWVVIAMLAGTAYFAIRRYAERADPAAARRNDFARCERAGGKVVQHSFGPSCEMRSRDGGRSCTYDDDCAKRLCVYANVEASAGTCDDFTTDNDGRPICH